MLIRALLARTQSGCALTVLEHIFRIYCKRRPCGHVCVCVCQRVMSQDLEFQAQSAASQYSAAPQGMPMPMAAPVAAAAAYGAPAAGELTDTHTHTQPASFLAPLLGQSTAPFESDPCFLRLNVRVLTCVCVCVCVCRLCWVPISGLGPTSAVQTAI